MTLDKTLKDIICEHVHFNGQKNNGWLPVRCLVCNDHENKGLRGGFKFEGDNVSYKCFNCNHKAFFDSLEHKKFSKNMTKVLRAFNIPEDECAMLLLKNYNTDSSEQKTKKVVNYDPVYIDLPDHFYRLTNETNNTFDQLAKLKLSERRINYNDYIFYMSTDPYWKARVIIPIFRNNKLIFYQGRDLLGSKKSKYLSVDVPKDKIIYGFHHLFEHLNRPLFVMEGFFDAFMVEGCALLGNTLTEAQIYHLNKSPRQKVYIPDMYGSGRDNAMRALDAGWKVSVPNIGDCKDINEAYCKYGKFYTLKSIVDKIMSDFEAKVYLTLHTK